MRQQASISQLVGQTFTAVVNNGNLEFSNDAGRFVFTHHQDCCENVYIYDVVGDLEDLIGSPITLAEEVSGEGPTDAVSDDSHTWTFYKFATIKGYVDVRWLGESNGYYSESVDLDFYPA